LVTITIYLLLYREVITVYSDIRKQHTKSVRGQNAEFINVKPGGTWSKHLSLKR